MAEPVMCLLHRVALRHVIPLRALLIVLFRVGRIMDHVPLHAEEVHKLELEQSRLRQQMEERLAHHYPKRLAVIHKRAPRLIVPDIGIRVVVDRILHIM